jgi:protein-tyrosine-phosphatase
MIREADLILAMGQQHRAAVIGLAAEAEGRTFALREYASTRAGQRPAAPEGGWDIADWDIADPFGCDRADYDRTATEIADALEPILAWLAAREDDGRRRTGP